MKPSSNLSRLHPIENLSQVDKIEKSLQEYFRSENLKPGDPIPKEMELAQALAVSRTAVREALARFKTLGIIDTKKNRGMVIANPDILDNMERVLDLRLLDNESMKDFFELRLILEIGISDLVFLRKTKEDLKRLEGIVTKYEKASDKTHQIRYDVAFHSTLYEISGNQTIQRFQKMLLSIFYYTDNKDGLFAIDIGKTEGYINHRDLLECLKKGTVEEFWNKMKRHLKQYFDKI